MKKYVIAIDAGGTYFKSAVISNDGDIIPESVISIKVDDVKDCYQKILRHQVNLDYKIEAVVVDTPGPFDYVNGKSLMTHKYQSIYNIPLRPWINDIIGDINVAFIHDSTAFLYGEIWNSSLQKYKNIAGVMIGTGLGFALMINGKLMLADNGGPYQSIYKLPLMDKTAEDHISARGIIERYGDEKLSAFDIAVRAESGDEKALNVYHETGNLLADLLDPLISKYRIECIVFGGQISKSFHLFREPLVKKYNAVKSDRIDTGHLLGAAYSVFKYYS